MSALEKAYQERNGRMPNLAVHPLFAFLRREPRFQKLLSEMGLLTVLQSEAVVAGSSKK
jgi:hypothetical protein